MFWRTPDHGVAIGAPGAYNAVSGHAMGPGSGEDEAIMVSEGSGSNGCGPG